MASSSATRGCGTAPSGRGDSRHPAVGRDGHAMAYDSPTVKWSSSGAYSSMQSMGASRISTTRGCGTAPSGRRNLRNSARSLDTATQWPTMPLAIWSFPSGARTQTQLFSATLDVEQRPSRGLPPSISKVVSASDFGASPASHRDRGSRSTDPTWRPTARLGSGDFTGGGAPTSLDGVSVTIGGQAAFVDYISATQVNAQLPSNISTGGVLPLTVTKGNVTSAPSGVTVNATEPGLLAPPRSRSARISTW